MGKYSLIESPGHLRYRVAAFHARGTRLLLLRQFRGDSWVLETRVSYFTGPSGGGRTFNFRVVFGSVPDPLEGQDGVTLIRHRDDWTGCCPGYVALALWERGEETRPRRELPLHPTDSYVFRIRRQQREVAIELSEDGVNFRLLDHHTFGAQIDGVSQFVVITGNSFANFDSFADYDYVRLTKIPFVPAARARPQAK